MGTSMWQDTEAALRANGVEAANAMLEARLRACKCRRFDALLGAHFSNDPTAIAHHVRLFLDDCSNAFRPAAAYFEMNGFDINPDRWYFDSFGYETYSDDPDDLDWLSDWSSDQVTEVALTGLENAQTAFHWYSNHSGHQDADAKAAAEVAILLTMVKFATLFERAAQHHDFPMDVPILATGP